MFLVCELLIPPWNDSAFLSCRRYNCNVASGVSSCEKPLTYLWHILFVDGKPSRPMIEIHLYGRLRELVPGSRANEDTVFNREPVAGENFEQFVNRLGLGMKDLGDCFINGTLAKRTSAIKDGDRVGLFPFNMKLIDGGQHIKGHGCIQYDIEVDHY
jgi:molybdopterin converting factor small subunit